MLNQINKLHQIAHKSSRKIIGLMSGTSLDGLDIAYCEISGSGNNTSLILKNFITIPYTQEFKKEVSTIFSVPIGSIELLTLLHAFIGKYHGDLINKTLVEWNIKADEIDLIASHGQTIYHAPKHLHKNVKYDNATLQIGDGDHLSVTTGIITISDFRQKHIAAGGEGAPLALNGDILLFSSPSENRILLNIGGISNITWLPTDSSLTPFATDLGPGNTMIDQFVRQNYNGLSFDQDGNIAARGVCHEELLSLLLNDDFFERPIPKTIGPELFNLNYLQRKLEGCSDKNISNDDIVSTLTALSAKAITNCISSTFNNHQYEIYASGGGIYNKVMMQHIANTLGQKIKLTTDLGINPDAKEAILFALLANECVAGSNQERKGLSNIAMGKISFPY